MDPYAHEKTIICRQLFAGHVVANEKDGKNESNDYKIYVWLVYGGTN